MKNFKHMSLLVLIWVITIIAFAISFSIYGTTFRDTPESPGEFVAIFFIILIFALFFGFICSIPAFLFFGVASFFILKTELDQKTKKFLILMVNYLDILATCGITYGLIYLVKDGDNSSFSMLEYVFWYPNWVILGVSTISILLLPFDKKFSLTNK